MARVIEIVKELERTVIHEECGAKVGFYSRELQSRVVHDYGGGSETIYYIICPNCGKEIHGMKKH